MVLRHLKYLNEIGILADKWKPNLAKEQRRRQYRSGNQEENSLEIWLSRKQALDNFYVEAI